eukprot:24215_1
MYIFGVELSSQIVYAIIAVSIFIIIFLWMILVYCCNRVKIPSRCLNEANVLITGGADGIGFSACKASLSKGSNIIIIDRNEIQDNKLQQLSNCKINSSQQIISILCDVSDFELMKKKIITTFEENKLDEIDVVICNAGIEKVISLEDSSIDDYKQTMNVNYFGTVNTIKITLPYLKKNKNKNKCGRIIVNCSLMGLVAMGYHSSYCASKYALRGFVESIFSELVSDHIYTSIVYPTDVKTVMLEREKQVDIPNEVKKLSHDAGVFEPDIVGCDIIEMVENGKYSRSWGLDGWMVMNLTVGWAISTSLFDAIVQMLFLGLLRTIGMFYIYKWFKVCRDSFKAKKQPNEAGALIYHSIN